MFGFDKDSANALVNFPKQYSKSRRFWQVCKVQTSILIEKVDSIQDVLFFKVRRVRSSEN